ncbi:MAG: FAD:protein FMN transferase [Prevotella sp.]|nr:FAD:protein FMN transferase [Prevotella sp.]MCM1075645.1 FAD:protein FMN transferase [Ruminococcus sp.]
MKHNTRIHILIAIIAVMFSACKNDKYISSQGIIWNTGYNIIYCADQDYTDSIIKTLNRVEMSVSAFNPNSLVSKINTNTGNAVDPDFINIYKAALEVNGLTQGAFDPTLAPLINLYGFGYEQINEPETAQLDKILQYVGIEKTSIKDNKLIKRDPRTQFNFSALAKGYGCDAVAQMFRSAGIADYMVEIGGEINMAGVNNQGSPWRISIDRPIFSNDSVIHDTQMIVELTDCGMATSGNYRNFKMVDGKRIVHTIDRHTGLPAINDMLSATIVIFNDLSSQQKAMRSPYPCMYADAFSTSCMSLGCTRAKKLVETQNIAAMFILADGTIYESPAFKQTVRKIE